MHYVELKSVECVSPVEKVFTKLNTTTSKRERILHKKAFLRIDKKSMFSALLIRSNFIEFQNWIQMSNKVKYSLGIYFISDASASFTPPISYFPNARFRDMVEIESLNILTLLTHYSINVLGF